MLVFANSLFRSSSSAGMHFVRIASFLACAPDSSNLKVPQASGLVIHTLYWGFAKSNAMFCQTVTIIVAPGRVLCTKRDVGCKSGLGAK